MSTETAARPIAVQYVKTIGIVNNGFNGRGFTNPVDTAVSRDGRVFVLNRCDQARATAIRVGICNLDEDYLGEFGDGVGDGDTQFRLVAAMAFDDDDRLHIVDEGANRVTVFDSDGHFLSKWGSRGTKDGEFDGPSGIAFDSGGNCYVSDQHNSRVQKFTGAGEFLAKWGEFGDGPGQFNMPWGIGVDANDNVYVADWRNDRIQKFSSSGEHIASFGGSGEGDGQLSRPSAVALDERGNMYVADWGNERVQVFDPEGAFLLKLRGEATISKWAAEFFASNPDEVKVREIADLTPELPSSFDTPYQISSQTEPYFWGPISVTLDSEGRLYVTETNRHRLQVYQAS